jgi:hypothetical protein
MRWRLLGLFFFGIAASVAWTFWWRPQAEVWLKGKIQSTLSQRFKQDVHLDALSLHPFLLRVQAVGVRVGPLDAPVFTCKRWTFYTAYTGESSPVSLFLLTFVRSQLDTPVFYALPSPRSGFVFPDRWWRGLPLHRLSWVQGSFVVPLSTQQPPLSFTDTEGTLQVSPGGFRVDIQGDSSVGPVHLALSGWESFRKGAQLDLRGDIRLERAPLDYFTPWIPERFGRFIGWASLSLRGALNDFSPDQMKEPRNLLGRVAWNGDVHFKDTIWFPPTARPKDLGVPLVGSLSVRNGEVEINDLEIFRSLHLSGTVSLEPPFRQDLRWWGNSIALEDLAESGLDFLRWVPGRGTVGTKGTLTGDRAHPELIWSAVFQDVGYPGILFPEMVVEGQWKSHWLTLTSKGLSGELFFEGPLSSGYSKTGLVQKSWNVGVSSLDLGALAKKNGWPHVGGRVNGTFSFKKSMDGKERGWPEAIGTLKVENLNWGIHKETAPVGGRLFLDREGLRIQGEQGVFDLDVRRSSGVWRVERLEYATGALRVWGRGHLRDADGGLHLEGGGSGLAWADFPPLVKRFPGGEGVLSAQARILGSWSDPVFTGAVQFQDVRWRPGGILHQGEADVRGGKGGLTLTQLRWDDTVTAEGSWLFGKGWQFSANVEKTNAERLFDFMESSGTVRGMFSGRASLSAGDRPGMEGWVRLSAETGHWGTLPFDETRAVIFFEGSRVQVESVEVTQKGGALWATGEVHRRALVPSIPGTVWDWRLEGVGDHFSAGPVVFSTSWSVRGVSRSRGGAGSGEFLSPGVSLSISTGSVDRHPSTEISLGSVRTSFSWTPDFIRMEDLVVERGIRASGQMERKEKTLAGKMRIRDLSLPRLFPGFSLDKAVQFGRVDGEVTLTGSGPLPRIEGTARFSDASWNGLPVKGDIRAQWNERLEVSRAAFSFPGGAGLFSGTVEPRNTRDGNSSFARWEGQLQWESLDPFFRSLGVPAPWTGSMESTVSVSGPLGNLEGTVSLSGEVGQGKSAVSQWQSRFRVAGSTVAVEEAVLKTPEGSWRIQAGSQLVYGGAGQWDFQLKNQLRNIHLGPLQLFGGLFIQGKGDVSGRVLSGRLGAESLWINQQVFDQDLAEIRWSPGRLDFIPIPRAPAFVQGSIRLDRWPQTVFDRLTLWESGHPRLVLDGELGPGVWDFTLQGKGLQADSLLSLADFDWPISGPWTVRVRGQGSFTSPDVRAEVEGGPGKIGPLPYDRLEADVHWEGEWIEAREFRLVRRKGYRLMGSGRFPVRAGGGVFNALELDLRLTEGKMAILKDIWPLCRSARGNFFGDLRVEPGKGTPRVTGSFFAKDGRFNLKTYAPKVRDLNGEISFQNDRARVESARARVGRGWIEMAGDIGIHGLTPVDYDLSIQSEGKHGLAVEVPQLSVPPGPLLGRFNFLSDKLKDVSYGEPHVSLRVTGPHGNHRIFGEIELEETRFTYPPTLSKEGGIPGPRWWGNFWRMATWDIRFKSGKETWYRNEFLDVRLDGNLHLVGHPGAWRANGRMDTEEGVINYLGQLFQVKRGLFELVTGTRTALGQVGIQAFVAGEADRIVTVVDPRGIASEDTISMVVDRALLSEMQPRFVSRNDPSLSSDRVAMRALGISTEQPVDQADRDQLLRGGLVQLVGTSAAPLTNRLAQKFGIGMISAIYEPSENNGPDPSVASGLEGNSPAKSSPLSEYLRGAGAAARIRLTDQLSGVYKIKLDEAKGQSYFHDQIELILRLKGSLFIRASTELDSQNVLGQPPERWIGLENQWRFGFLRWRKKTVDLESIK